MGIFNHMNTNPNINTIISNIKPFFIKAYKMKMLVPLDMNGKKILNTKFDLKFKDLFKLFKCYFKVSQQGHRTLLF